MAPNANAFFFPDPSSSTTMTIPEFCLPSEWDRQSAIPTDLQQEELSATSHEEASKVLEQWQSDDVEADRMRALHPVSDATVATAAAASTVTPTSMDEEEDEDDVDLDIMKVDEQIGSNLLGEDIFGTSMPTSPTGPLEELVYMNLDDEDDDDAARFLVPLLDRDAPPVSAGTDSANAAANNDTVIFDERYQAIWKKLEESMKRSSETRKSLRMKTSQTEKYPRTSSVHGVLSSIESSSQQLLQAYLTHVQQRPL